MSIRKTLFGYEIRDGRIAANDREADVVRRIFKLYRNGESYKSVADALNREGVPYSGDAPQWDKCKVKRTLENPRYAGWDGYPSIITKEDFQGVQAVIRTKSSGSKRNEKGKNPVALLKPYLRACLVSQMYGCIADFLLNKVFCCENIECSVRQNNII